MQDDFGGSVGLRMGQICGLRGRWRSSPGVFCCGSCVGGSVACRLKGPARLQNGQIRRAVQRLCPAARTESSRAAARIPVMAAIISRRKMARPVALRLQVVTSVAGSTSTCYSGRIHTGRGWPMPQDRPVMRSTLTHRARQARSDRAALPVIRDHRGAGRSYGQIAKLLDLARIKPPSAWTYSNDYHCGSGWSRMAVKRICDRHGIN